MLEDRLRPFYPKAGKGRQPYPLSVMLRTHCVQLFYNLNDPGKEDLLYESEPVRRFVGLRLSGPLPYETTILNFRHLLEKQKLGQGLLDEINAHLESRGLKLRERTIVDATIIQALIQAPASTKSRAGERDTEMHQTKKGNQWHFGMKAHIGEDADTGIVHSMSTTAANAHDVTEAHNLVHGGETVVWGDAGYQGVHQREENLGLELEWRVAMRPGRRRKLEPGSEEALTEKAAAVRAGVVASLPEDEAAVRVCQGALPWAGEEDGTLGIAVRLRQPADGGGSTGGVVRPGTGQYGPYGPRRSPTVPPGAKGKCPNAGRQLPGCGSHNPRRPENTIQAKPSLVQSIPSTTTTGLWWRLRPAFAAGVAASLVGAAHAFVA